MKVIYICDGFPSVYESQVLELLTYMQSQGIDVTLMQGCKNKSERLMIEACLKRHEALNVVWYTSFPSYGLFERIHCRNIYKSLISIPDYASAVIHVRDELSCYLLKQVLIRHQLPNPLLIDIRSALFEEFEYRIANLSGLRKMLFKIQLRYWKRFCRKLFACDTLPITITSVSPLLNESISAHFPECRYQKVCHPNIAGRQFVFNPEKGKEIRRRFGFADNDMVVICSSNGGAIWQKDTQLIRCLVKKGYKVINLSPKNLNIDGCITMTVPFTDMPDYLSAADIAVLWRDDVFMNNCASSSKFSEFAAMGLYVIHNRSVAVATNFITENNAGVLCKDLESVSIDKNVVMSRRKERYEAGQRIFSVRYLGQSYINEYQKLLGSKRKIKR